MNKILFPEESDEDSTFKYKERIYFERRKIRKILIILDTLPDNNRWHEFLIYARTLMLTDQIDPKTVYILARLLNFNFAEHERITLLRMSAWKDQMEAYNFKKCANALNIEHDITHKVNKIGREIDVFQNWMSAIMNLMILDEEDSYSEKLKLIPHNPYESNPGIEVIKLEQWRSRFERGTRIIFEKE